MSGTVYALSVGPPLDAISEGGNMAKKTHEHEAEVPGKYRVLSRSHNPKP